MRYPSQTNNEAAYAYALAILNIATVWRPLPDLTLLITDDVTTVVHRAEGRNRIQCANEQWRLHHRAAALFGHLAGDDPHRVIVFDHRRLDAGALIDRIAAS